MATKPRAEIDVVGDDGTSVVWVSYFRGQEFLYANETRIDGANHKHHANLYAWGQKFSLAHAGIPASVAYL